MKTLANCTLKEFLQQINKIKKKAAAFYDVIGIGDIIRTLPVFKGDETPEQRKEMRRKQGMKNISAIIDKCIDENIDATVELIGLMCFKSADEAAEMEVSELIDVVLETVGSQRCIDFFTRLDNSGLINMGDTSTE